MTNYGGVAIRSLSITQTMVYYAGKEFLADGYMAAQALVDDLLANAPAEWAEDFRVVYQGETVTRCDFIGRTVHGICAVVMKGTEEVYRTAASTKRIGPKLAAQAWIASQVRG
jgi:hypothetical protein